MEKKCKLLIVEDCIEEQQAMYNYFIKKPIFSEIETASNGYEAINKIKSMTPDIVLLDLIMPDGIDGIEVLEQIKKLNINTKVMIVSALSFNEITIKTIKEGALYYILKPYNLDIVYKRILSLLNSIEEDNLIIRISSYLQLLGISTALKGYSYMREAIYISIKRQKDYLSLQEIYKIISIKYLTSQKSVERAIDNAIDNAVKKNNINTYFEFFGNTINDIRCKPSPREFISMITDKLLIEDNYFYDEYSNMI